MSYSIVECSASARAKIKPQAEQSSATVEVNTHHRSKYPIDELHVGQAFAVAFNEANEASLRLTASTRGKKTGKKFCVIKHVDFTCFEIARIA